VTDDHHDAYYGMTDAEHEPMTAEEERTAELILDAQDEARHAAEQAAAEAVQPADDPDECTAEMVDGSYTYCGCEDCDQREYEDIEFEVEMGHISESEALERHALNGAL
jgi:hypothetical protein